MIRNCRVEFDIHFHHGGSIVKDGGLELYVGGNITHKVDFDEDRFGYFDLIDEVKKLGYDQWSKLTYKIPTSMKMVDIRDDKDVMVMLVTS